MEKEMGENFEEEKVKGEKAMTISTAFSSR